MKRLILALLVSTPAMAFNPPDYSVSFDADSGTVPLSTSTVTPTKLLNRDSGITGTWIINTSSFTVFISTTSTVNLTSSPSIPPCIVNTNCLAFTLDGPNTPFMGDLWAVQVGTSSTTNNRISVIRLK